MRRNLCQSTEVVFPRTIGAEFDSLPDRCAEIAFLPIVDEEPHSVFLSYSDRRKQCTFFLGFSPDIRDGIDIGRRALHLRLQWELKVVILHIVRKEDDIWLITFHTGTSSSMMPKQERSEERRVGKECRSRWS